MSVLASTMARLDDWMNPIAVKELRQAVRGKFVMVALILSLLAELIAVAGIAIMSSLGSSNPAAAGSDAFTLLFSVVFTAAIFFIPMYSGFRMAAERADANVDLLFITTIRPRTIVFGKVMAAAGLVALLFSASLPFLMFSYVLRGVDFTSIMFLTGFAVLLVISHSITALFIGCLPASRPFKILMALGFFFATIGVHVPMLALTSEVLRGGLFFSMPRFWAGIAAGVAVIVAIDAVLMVLMTAIITPAAANRALPIRVMLSAVWLVSLGAAMWGDGSTTGGDFAQVWAVVQLFIITLVLLSATSERESWGPRVRRTIPRNPFVRAVAFLFYSGGAGGTLWAMLMYSGTLIAYALLIASRPRVVVRVTLTQHLLDAALAMIGYAMTAVLLRRKVLKRIPAERTWGIVLALFIALTLLPPLLILAGDAETSTWNTAVHITTIANPFPTAQRTAELRASRTLVLGIWAGAMLLANLPWFLTQLRSFGPQPPWTAAASGGAGNSGGVGNTPAHDKAAEGGGPPPESEYA